jgi:hypothetical protein
MPGLATMILIRWITTLFEFAKVEGKKSMTWMKDWKGIQDVIQTGWKMQQALN